MIREIHAKFSGGESKWQFICAGTLFGSNRRSKRRSRGHGVTRAQWRLYMVMILYWAVQIESRINVCQLSNCEQNFSVYISSLDQIMFYFCFFLNLWSDIFFCNQLQKTECDANLNQILAALIEPDNRSNNITSTGNLVNS